MAKFLDTAGITHYLSELMKHAEERLILISPYLKVNKNLKLILEDKNRIRIYVHIIYGKNELQPEENNWLKSLDFVRSSFCQDLHAKCYLSEKEAIITSMNLYEFSQVNNQEMGIHVSKDTDTELYKAINDEVQRLIRISDQLKVSVEKVAQGPDPRDNKEKVSTKVDVRSTKSSIESGHCIRCNKEVTLKPESPYCRDCWSDWSKIDKKDEKHPEKFCHLCGSQAKTTFEKPRCYSCFKTSQ